MLSAFDLPDNVTSCGRRDITTVPNQCLTLLNNRTMREQAAAFAERLLRETRRRRCRSVAAAGVAVRLRPRDHGRRAKSRAVAFLAERTGEPSGDAADATQPAVAELCLALFNTNEFIYHPVSRVPPWPASITPSPTARCRAATGSRRSAAAWARGRCSTCSARDGRADVLRAPRRAAANPLAPKPPHFPAKAKSVIFLMMAGGPSQMETFDPKPVLNKLAGQRMPESFGTIPAQFTDVTKQPLLGLQAQVPPVRPVGPADLRGVAAPPAARRQARRHPQLLPRRVQPLAGAVRAHDRPVAAGLAERRRVDHLRPGQRVGQPAGDGRDDRRRRQGEGRHAAAGATASCRPSTRARRCRRRRHADPVSRPASRASRATSQRQDARPVAVAEPTAQRARRRPRPANSTRASRPTSWPSACRPPRRRRSTCDRKRRPRRRSTAWTTT